MPLYDYECPQGHLAELLRPWGVATVLCACGEPAARQAVYRVAALGHAAVPPTDRNYRQPYSEYREAVAEVADHYGRVNGERGPGEQVRVPDYYGLAKAQAVSKGAKVR